VADRNIIKETANRELETLEIMLTSKVARTASSLEEYINVRLTQGVSLATIRADLTKDLLEGGRIFGEFRNAFKATFAGSVSRFRDTGQIGEIGVDVKFRWVAVLVNTCEDCLARHGKVRTWDKWEAEGLPRTGQTVCKENCKCVLIPMEATEFAPIMRG